ncbi:MAG: hypothetical protein OES20_18185 [Gammaproteobacteria bacterium]|nr:hypothetical protein [Gammaproteobacteria bacterium]
MTGNKSVFWKIGVAGLALTVAVGVYILVRLNPPGLLAPFQVTSSLLGTQLGLFGSAPALFYTLSIGLFIGVLASTSSSGLLHCMIWIAVALCLEISQVPFIATSFAAWFSTTLPDAVWELIGPYWTRGVFDPYDLLATVLGGAIAMFILSRLPREEKHAANH